MFVNEVTTINFMFLSSAKTILQFTSFLIKKVVSFFVEKLRRTINTSKRSFL